MSFDATAWQAAYAAKNFAVALELAMPWCSVSAAACTSADASLAALSGASTSTMAAFQHVYDSNQK